MKKEKSQERSLEPSNYIKSELKDHLNEFEEDNKLLDSLNLGSSVQAGSNKSRKKKAIPENDQIKQVDQLDSIEQCPDCGGQIIYEAGCNKCVECGWGLCSI